MSNRLNILHWKCTTADKFSYAFSSKWFFQRRIRFWSKIYDSWKVTLLAAFLENLTGQEHQFWQFWNELLYKLIILLNKLYFGLDYCVLIKSFETLLETYNYSVM